MISPLRNERHPYALPSNIIYFFDWRYVHHGSHSSWLTASGERKRFWTTDPVEPTLHIPGYMPSGIRLRAKPAQKTEPFLVPEGDEDMIWSGGVVIHEEGRYRLWYETAGKEHIDHPKYNMGSFDYIRYAESDDGETWRQPSLGLLERNGTKTNNLVYGVPLIDNTGLHGATIFKDPSAPPEERYKMFHTGQMGGDMKEGYLRDRPNELGAQSHAGEKLEGFFGAVSPDGLGWTPLKDALISQVSDTHNVCEYDPVLGQYVAYCRSHYLMRRSIGRLASSDFRRFPLSEEVFWPNATNEPYDLWYGNAKTVMPGTTDYHIMFPLRWRLIDDSFAFLLAASPDNVMWNPVPGGPVCRPGEPGDFDYGTVAAGVGVVNLPGDRMGVTVGCSSHGHKQQLRQRPDASINWATWKKGRLAALEAPEEGNFRTFQLTIPQRRAYLNFKTAVGGRVEVQVCDSKYKPIPGRGYEECDWLVGDETDRELAWKGESDLGHEGDGPISLSFRLRCAELYSVEFR